MNERKIEVDGEINGLKQALRNTDYQAIKYAEGQISEEDYAEIRTNRQELRDRINALESTPAYLSDEE